MNKSKALLIPFTLGLLTTACSTTNQQTQNTVLGEAQANESQASAQDSSQPTQDEHRLASQAAKITELEQALLENNQELASLHKALDEKDQIIYSMQQQEANAELLNQLTIEKQLRSELEEKYSALKLENTKLKDEIARLEQTSQLTQNRQADMDSAEQDSVINREFLQLNDSFQRLDSAHFVLNKKYQSLLGENARLQDQYDALKTENTENERTIRDLKAENLRLGGALSDVRAQHQVLWDKIQAFNQQGLQTTQSQPNTEQTVANTTPVVNDQDQRDLIAALDSKNTELESQVEGLSARLAFMKEQQKIRNQEVQSIQQEFARMQQDFLDKQEVYEIELTALNAKRELLEEENKATRAQLEQATDDLLATQTKLQAMTAHLSEVESALAQLQKINKDQENEAISVRAQMAGFQGQLNTEIKEVVWQVPSQMSLNDTFEVIVTASLNSPVAGQTYQAQLLTDSDINMISAEQVESVVDEGRLQWRWRLSGLNEKPNAQMNLFVVQNMSYQEQSIARLVYQDKKALTLTNDDLVSKYGYWIAAILAGLLGGFLVGRVNKSKNS
ncbi:hypothetical protein [Marinomonas epiphytica]